MRKIWAKGMKKTSEEWFGYPTFKLPRIHLKPGSKIVGSINILKIQYSTGFIFQRPELGWATFELKREVGRGILGPKYQTVYESVECEDKIEIEYEVEEEGEYIGVISRPECTRVLMYLEIYIEE